MASMTLERKKEDVTRTSSSFALLLCKSSDCYNRLAVSRTIMSDAVCRTLGFDDSAVTVIESYMSGVDDNVACLSLIET
jgi:hypothetical protein